MRTNDELERLIQHLIERVNRIEQMVARSIAEPDAMIGTVDHAIDCLGDAVEQIGARLKEVRGSS